jgi:hypothetical protein
MQNEQGEYVDIILPRKCTATNRLLHSRDYASVQINVFNVKLNKIMIIG